MLCKITGRAQFRLALLMGHCQSTAYVATISRAAFLEAEGSPFRWAQPTWQMPAAVPGGVCAAALSQHFRARQNRFTIVRIQQAGAHSSVHDSARGSGNLCFSLSFPWKPPGCGSLDTSLSLSPGYKTVSKLPQERRWRHWCCHCSSLDTLSTMNNFRKTVRITGFSLTNNFQHNYRSLKNGKTEAWGLAAQRKRAKLVETKLKSKASRETENNSIQSVLDMTVQQQKRLLCTSTSLCLNM